MDRSHYVGSKSGFNKFPPLFGNAKFWAEQGLSRCGAECHDYLRLNHRNLGLEPGTASRNFLSVWFFVDAAFAPWLPFKMFDNIGDVGFGAIDAGLVERIIK